MHDIFSYFSDRMKAYEKRSIIGVSVSGGADSMALLSLAVSWGSQFGVKVKALTIDHGLRPESAVEAVMVSTWCEQRGVEHTTYRWSGPESGNVMEQAREARLSAIDAWRNECDVVLVGHSRTDQAETVMMRLMRGSGVDGLSGMEFARSVFGANGAYTIVRPLIDVSREDIRQFCLDEAMPFCDDPSNENEKYLRVKVRKTMAALGVDEEGLVATANRQARASKALEACVDRFWCDHACFNPVQGESVSDYPNVVLSREAFEFECEEIQLRIILRAVKLIGKSGHPPRERAVLGALASILSGKGASLHGCLIRVKRDSFWVECEDRG